MANLKPENTMLVIYANGKEVGRKAATAPNVQAYIELLQEQYGSLEIKYEEAALEAQMSRLFSIGSGISWPTSAWRGK